MSEEHDRVQLRVSRWVIGAFQGSLLRHMKRLHGIEGWREIGRYQADDGDYWIGFERPATLDTREA